MIHQPGKFPTRLANKYFYNHLIINVIYKIPVCGIFELFFRIFARQAEGMQETGTGVLTHESFEQLFHRYEQKLYRIAYSYLRDRDAARDVVHECFTSVWDHRANIETKVEAYLYQSVKNECLKYRRNRNLKKAVYEKILMKERCVMDYYTHTIESCNPDEVFSTEILEICRKQIEQMPELRRQIFMAKKFE